MMPSLVTWPMRNTANPLDLARLRKRSAHSRNWVTEPAELSIAGS